MVFTWLAVGLAIMEVLLEIESSRKRLVGVTEETLVSAVEQELSVLGDVALLPFKHSTTSSDQSKDYYILQRWSDRWGGFVDVKEASEVMDGDRLTVVLCSKPSTSKSNVSCAPQITCMA